MGRSVARFTPTTIRRSINCARSCMHRQLRVAVPGMRKPTRVYICLVQRPDPNAARSYRAKTRKKRLSMKNILYMTRRARSLAAPRAPSTHAVGLHRTDRRRVAHLSAASGGAPPCKKELASYIMRVYRYTPPHSSTTRAAPIIISCLLSTTCIAHCCDSVGGTAASARHTGQFCCCRWNHCLRQEA